MTKADLIHEFTTAYECVIAAAQAAAQQGSGQHRDTWGPREIVAHLAGWEVIATVRVPQVAAGMPPIEFGDARQQRVMNDAINATIVTMIGEQSLDALCGMLRRAYQHDVALLQQLDDRFFQPGEYVYERTKDVLEHCQEHLHDLAPE